MDRKKKLAGAPPPHHNPPGTTPTRRHMSHAPGRTFEGACAARARGEDGPALNPESVKSGGAFRDMAARGLLTFDSQEGIVRQLSAACVDPRLYQRVVLELPEPPGARERSPLSVPARQMKVWADEYARRGGTFERGVRAEKAYVAGFMLRGRARAAADEFNMTTDKLAFVRDGVECVGDSSAAYRIPVTFDRLASGRLVCHTSLDTWDDARWAADHAEVVGGLLPGEAARVAQVVFVDPKPGRHARSPDGLHADILAALCAPAAP